MKLNHYQVCREEQFVSKQVGTFPTLEEARQYVIEKSMAHTDMIPVLQLPFLEESKRDKAIQDFCFDNDLYLTHRRFFIHHVPWKELAESWRQQGVTVRLGSSSSSSSS